MQKFIKLDKTKEEMTKYCMRKAFKFIGDMKIKAKKKGSRSRKEDSEFLSLEMPFKYRIFKLEKILKIKQ